MGKEILFGTFPVLIVFLVFIGVNVAPFIIAALVLSLLMFVIMRQGGMSVTQKKTSVDTPKTQIKFNDIGGQERAKKELREALDFLIHKDTLKKYGIRPLKGILLTGPPGTGKTLMAKAAANYTNSAFIAASGSQFVEMYVGVGAQRIRDLFKEAKQKAEKNNQDSAIIFIDEIDVLGGKREGSQHREYDQTLNQLLTEMDGITTSENPRILIVAATNRADMLDDALIRPGRFDRQIVVDLPDKKARKQILEIHVKNKPLADDVDIDAIARDTFNFSGAQLESVTNEAAIYAFRENSTEITQRHFSHAIDKVMMGEQTDRESTAEERERVANHELGHAIVSEVVRPLSVSQVSLRPRGQALGYVRQSPQQDRYLYTVENLEQQIMIALGGAVAEEIIYGGRSTGSRNDFEQALHLVNTMIDTGLSRLGIVKVDMVSREALHEERQRILNELLEETRAVLRSFFPVFKHALDHLLREEVLNGDEFRAMIANAKNMVKKDNLEKIDTQLLNA
ncbi:AAA family ATPase [Aneurinibacillus sp. Ricciae_BoGa-3]|uniref:AAA family ATPase n=1 Tax=Aneurinibacillus sp. Ricciae_BoGa-3 TaxID=3022697 RepID=UPI0023418D6B|nr:AAA family ATPase [Aneurinibacillus sp. Ricciae_BoGa-3]WCK56125.1 AAA family ATPase [Aneurinibacillus sp. Ricciae_BoGa-3]